MKNIGRLVLIISLLAQYLSFPAQSVAEIYAWEDKDGSLHYTDSFQKIPKDKLADARQIESNEPGDIIPEKLQTSFSKARTNQSIKLISSIESGTAPLTVSFRIDSSFIAPKFSRSATGPVPVNFLEGSSPQEFSAKFVTDGVYEVSISATGPDKRLYSDKMKITVESKSQLETLLQGQWAGIRAKLAQTDVEGAVSYIVSYNQNRHREIFKGFGQRLPTLSADASTLRLEYAAGDTAKCILIRQENVIGKQQNVAYPVYFNKENGSWKLQKY